MSDFYIILKNMTRKPLRLFLMVFATFIAFFIYGVATSFENAMNAGVELSADDRLITVNKINFTQPLPMAYVNKVKTVENVQGVVHMNWFGGYYQQPQNFVQTFAVDEESLLDVYDKEIVLSEDERRAWLQNRQAIIVGPKTAANYGWEKGDRIPLRSNIFTQQNGSDTWEFDIVAIYGAEDPQADLFSVYIHYDYFNETQSFGGDYIGWMGVRTTDPQLNETVIKAIDDLFVNSPFETETVPEKTFSKAFIAQAGNIGLIVGTVVAAAFFIILVIVGNSMVLSVRERTGEIGVLKTLGFRSERIFVMVLVEALMLAFFGGGLGILLASVATDVINSFNLPFTMLLDQAVVLEAIGAMLLLGLVTGIIPAVNALRLNIITALSKA